MSLSTLNPKSRLRGIYVLAPVRWIALLSLYIRCG